MGKQSKHLTARSQRIPIGTILWAVGVLMLGSSVRAEIVTFNPTGTPGAQEFQIGGIDLGPGNALAVGAVPLTPGQTFQLDYQATLAGLIDPTGHTFVPSGLNTAQITAVASFTEVVTSLSGPNNSVATFALAPTQAPNSFFELWSHPGVNANNLAGTGFNGGTLVLAGTPSLTAPNGAVFSATNAAPGALDQFLTNNYPGVNTITGSGSATAFVNVTSSNSAFITTPLPLIQLSFNSSLITPFAEVDPSALFVGQPGGGAPIVTPNVGTINGVTGPDFQFQADANFNFITIPEPPSVVLASLGFMGVLCLGVWMKK